MRFKLDENLPAEAAELLRTKGHGAVTVLEQEMGGNPDGDVAAACQREGRALLTLDTDFADIRTYPPAAYPGIVVLRLEQQDKIYLLAVLQRLLALLDVGDLAGHLWIVDEKRVRVRE